MEALSHRLPFALALLLAGLPLVGTSCNSHPVDYSEAQGAVEHLETVAGGTGSKVDILWVLDNSQSMCQEQRELRDNFRSFIDILTEGTAVDMNVGVTTTHIFYATESPPEPQPEDNYDKHLFSDDEDPSSEDTNFEPIAEAGQLQNLPNPPVAFDASCHFGVDDDADEEGPPPGTLIDEDHPRGPDFSPIADQLNQAVECTENPGNYEKWNDSHADLAKCAFIDEDEEGADYSYCEDIGKEDSYDISDFVAEVFPCGVEYGRSCNSEEEFREVYRDVPLVLRTSDYRNANGALQKDKLREDFSCMSFVGTRGDSFEQGMRAASYAVHPLMTGGPAEDPYNDKTFTHPATDEEVELANGENRPNHGFLREDATTGLIFLTDENDCSHTNHTILERSQENSCGELNCYYPTAEGSDRADDLISTEDLYNDFIENLKTSRRLDDLGSQDLVVASIHGYPERYGSIPEQEIENDCSRDRFNELRESLSVCANSLGEATSGDRYAEFLELAQDDGFETTVPSDTDDGLMCQTDGTLDGPLEDIADALKGSISGCLSNRVMPCADASDCPDFNTEYERNTGGEVCSQWGAPDADNGKYCRSAIRVQMHPANDESLDELSDSDKSVFDQYCVEESVGVPRSNGCIIDRQYYEWQPCAGNDNQIQLVWRNIDGDPENIFGGFEVQARYTEDKNARVDAPRASADAGN